MRGTPWLSCRCPPPQALSDVDGKRYVTGQLFEQAPAVTFLWARTIPLKVYPPALIPLVMA